MGRVERDGYLCCYSGGGDFKGMGGNFGGLGGFSGGNSHDIQEGKYRPQVEVEIDTWYQNQQVQKHQHEMV